MGKKYVLIFLIFSAMIFGLLSCKKSYTCSCDSQTNSGVYRSQTKQTLSNMKKKQAEASCNEIKASLEEINDQTCNGCNNSVTCFLN